MSLSPLPPLVQPPPPPTTTTQRHVLRILMVGEGDFSASLAILRAYQQSHDDSQPKIVLLLVMTTLLSSCTDLYETYPSTAENNICEIQRIIYNQNHHHHHQDDNKNNDNNNNNHVVVADSTIDKNQAAATTTTTTTSSSSSSSSILYNIDACQLHTSPTKQRLQQQLRHLQQEQQFDASKNYEYSNHNNNCHSCNNNDLDDDDNNYCYSNVLFDLIIFQYPHLGIISDNQATIINEQQQQQQCNDRNHNHTESILRQRHISLMYHYLYSASQLSLQVHVTLNQNQYQSWIVQPSSSSSSLHGIQNVTTNSDIMTTIVKSKDHEAITTLTTTSTGNGENHIDNDITDNVEEENKNTIQSLFCISQLQLKLVKVIPVQQPFHFIFPSLSTTTPCMLNCTQQQPTTKKFAATTTINSTTTAKPIKRRISKKYDGGSHRHYLSKYGYHHVRTITPTTNMALDNHSSPHKNNETITKINNSKRKKNKMPSVSLLGSCHYVFERDVAAHCDNENHENVATHEVSSYYESKSTINNHNDVDCSGTNNHNHQNEKITCMICPICCVSCSNPSEYMIHLQNPTAYPIVDVSTTSSSSTTGSCIDKKSTTGIIDNNNTKSCESTIVTNTNITTPMCESAVISTTEIGTSNGTVEEMDNMLTNCTNQGKAEFPLSTLGNSCSTSTDRATLVFIVRNEHVGKRLRWFLQNAVVGNEIINYVQSNTITRNTTPKNFSKRQSDRLIQNGFVSINDEVVTDSSRILHEVGWTIRVVHTQQYLPNISGSKDKTSNGSVENETTFSASAISTSVADTEASDTATKVTIVEAHTMQQSFVNSSYTRTLLIVWKPVGMRTIGSFTNATLEQYLYNHQNQRCNTNKDIENDSTIRYRYKSISKLDKCCGGLCVVQQAEEGREAIRSATEVSVQVQHTFAALVYGIKCPEQWRAGTSITLPVHGMRRWNSSKRQRRQLTGHKIDDEDNDNDSDFPSSYVVGVLYDGKDADATDRSVNCEKTVDTEASIALIEQTINTNTAALTDIMPALSTISISTSSTVSGLAQTIGYYLRSNNHAIVGDRMAVQEYNTLPRAVRNRIKQKLCFGCTGVRIKVTKNNDDSLQPLEQCFETKLPIPLRWSATYWQEFCMNQTTLSSNSE